MLNQLLNLLFPPQCLSCDALVPANGTLCLSCWQKVHFITDPMCGCCGLPFDFDLGENALCGDCLRDHPDFGRARAVFRYDDHSSPLITKFKYADQTQLAPIYGTWLNKAGKELIAISDLIIPVPLHYWRFIGRRYNQSALLARAIARHNKLPLHLNLLKRKRATTPQTGLSYKQRQKNVSGAFTINPRDLGKIKGKNILLIDDVYTTGATLKACTKTLLKAGAAQVNVLTLSRTLR